MSKPSYILENNIISRQSIYEPVTKRFLIQLRIKIYIIGMVFIP